MWIYKNVTRDEFEMRKDFVENILIELGAVPTEFSCEHKVSSLVEGMTESIVSHRKIFEYERQYYRVCEALLPEKPFIVIEYADSRDKAINGVMEDCDPFPYDLSDSETINQVKAILRD